MSMFAMHPVIQRKPTAAASHGAHSHEGGCACGGRCAACRARRSASRHPVPESAGQPLDAGTRGFMESRFGRDFSQVRIHADRRAADMAADMDARAFTIGRDVVFASGEYAPATTAGRRLIAHELAHTIQQRSSDSPSPQARLRSDDAGDAAESAADRAADTVMRGAPAPVLAPVEGGIVQRQRTRTCTRSTTSGDTTTVRCSDNAEYDVRTVIVRDIVPSTDVSVTGGLQQGTTIFLQLEICRGGDSVRIIPSMNVAQPLQQLIQNALSGSPGVTGVQIAPTATFSWARSREFEAEVYGGPVIAPGAPRTGWEAGVRGQYGRWTGQVSVGSDPTLTGPGGRPEIHGGVSGGITTGRVRQVDCHKPRATVTYACTPITHTRGEPGVDPDDVEVYVFFDYATAAVIAPTPMFMRGSVEDRALTLRSLAAQGYRVQSVDAHTSPEGPRPAARRHGGFVGNDVLSQQRRDAALAWLRGQCPDCIATEPTATAESELYSGWRRPGVELEGDPLTVRARELFLGHPVTPPDREHPGPDPLRRPADERLAALPPARQREELYPRLRRAVIHLHRAGRAAVPSERQSGASGDCPADVRAAMQRP